MKRVKLSLGLREAEELLIAGEIGCGDSEIIIGKRRVKLLEAAIDKLRSSITKAGGR